jgi:hypothetical protein
MAVYYCHRCDRYIDNDYDPCEIIDDEMICGSCYEDIEDEDNE